MGSKHGRMLTFPSPPGALDLPPRRLDSIGEVIELLGETLTRVQQAPFHFRAANTIGFLPAILPKALGQRVEEPVGGHKRTENELKAITSLPRTKVEPEVLEHQLMELVVGLDQDKHPATKLEAIKAAYVINGTLESGSTRRVIPTENKTGATENTYTSLFNRLRGNSSSPSLEEPREPDLKVYDLYPCHEADSPEGTLPPSGESIDDPPNPPKSLTQPRVITVEVG